MGVLAINLRALGNEMKVICCSIYKSTVFRMKPLFIIPLVLMSLVSFPSWGETVDDLVERGGIFYKKFSDVPFTGKVEGISKGRYKKGKKEGYWVHYHHNGQLSAKGEMKNGKFEGYWEFYNSSGEIVKLHTGTYKNGVKVSD